MTQDTDSFSDTLPPNVNAIRDSLSGVDAYYGKRPLPLAAHWQSSSYILWMGDNNAHYIGNDSAPHQFWDTKYQIGKIRDGEYIFPTIAIPNPNPKYSSSEGVWLSKEDFAKAYVEQIIEPLMYLKLWHLPFCTITTQYEQDLYNEKREWYNLPFADNPCLYDVAGNKSQVLDPLGPIKPWIEVAHSFWKTTSDFARRHAEIYPNPPAFFILSNNEPHRLSFAKYNADTGWKRYVDKNKDKIINGKSALQSPSLKFKELADGFYKRYKAFIRASKDVLPSGWKSVSKMIGYGAGNLGHYARWAQWQNYSMAYNHEGEICIDGWAPAWDGSSHSMYLSKDRSDTKIWSPHIESFNIKWAKDLVREGYTSFGIQRQDYHFEVSIYDYFNFNNADPGHLSNWNKDRYKAYIRFLMWVLNPRVVREFRGWSEPRNTKYANGTGTYDDYWKQVLAAVREVHENATLKKYWQEGQLVAHDTRTHPYRTAPFPAEVDARSRMFLLTTNKEPVGWASNKFTLTDKVNVWAIARRIGYGDSARYLIFAYSPLGVETNIEITIPNGPKITVNTSVAGNFWEYANSTLMLII